jgi:hypothetical protein
LWFGADEPVGAKKKNKISKKNIFSAAESQDFEA